jgi:amidohydrolase
MEEISMENISKDVINNNKDKLLSIIEREKQSVIDVGNKIFRNPELGYKEVNTKETIKEFLKDINITKYEEYAITGMKYTIGSGEGLHIGLLCDMDATPTFNHPLANKEDNAAHSCGHNAQMAIMMAVFRGIAKSNLLDEIDGKISLITAPAEEFVDFDYRLNLMKDGKIKAFSGKQNLLLEGAFDDIDLILSSHGNGLKGRVIETDISTNGFVAKTATFLGKSAHAGAYPHLGKNALNAASLSLNAVALLRETFQDDHHVRFHPVITKGGTAVNTVPDEVVVETYVRASEVQAVFDADRKIDNAFIHCAKALGCECEINNIPGYLPSNYYSPLAKYIVDNAKLLVNEDNIICGGKTFASDDLADISCFVPVIQIGFSGFCGGFHSHDFDIKDEEMAYITPAKLLSLTAYDMLMYNEQLKLKLEKFKSPLTRQQYYNEWLGIK